MRPAAAALFAILAACGGPGPAPEPARKADAPKAKPPAVYKVALETTAGRMVIEVKREWASRAADHFHQLVTAGFYDGVRFHRVLREYIAQFGINGDPKTHRLFATVPIPDDPVRLKNRRGAVAFAKIGPNSRTTEVFINLRNNPELDSAGFAAFGQVVEGMEAADKISSWYGELAPRGRGPDAAKIQQLGNSYLSEKFPKLDTISRAFLLH